MGAAPHLTDRLELLVRIKKALFERVGQQLRHGSHTKLCHEAAAMLFNRLDRYMQPISDRLAGVAKRDQRQHLALSVREVWRLARVFQDLANIVSNKAITGQNGFNTPREFIGFAGFEKQAVNLKINPLSQQGV